MDISVLFDSSMFQYILPVLIFLSRIVDVSLGTLRIIFVSKGLKYLAPLIGFFEILIWLIVISQIMRNLTNPINYLAYAAGFAAGNFVGIYLEDKLALGTLLLRIITKKKAKELIQYFRADGYKLTNFTAESNVGEVDIIYFPVRRKEVKSVIEMIKTFNPNAFYTLSDVRMINRDALPYTGDSRLSQRITRRLFRFKRKGK
jgi:uncharacterized protein YebE (UPF0316 family)